MVCHPAHLGRRIKSGPDDVLIAGVSRITLFDGPVIMEFDGLPASASRLL
jgi:hypothetical protein